ncbi:hypothetical protein K502DRAFT_325235 [Neoconidiobolus thromboides FSU 785]|nr:hypothetical protein K502DRAFT_325235 [Neoconidiobolus thromboides FSU 785]
MINRYYRLINKNQLNLIRTTFLKTDKFHTLKINYQDSNFNNANNNNIENKSDIYDGTLIENNKIIETAEIKKEAAKVTPLTNTYQGHELGKYNRDLESKIKNKRLDEAYKIIQKIKTKNIQPDLVTFNLILSSIQFNKDFNLSLNVLKDLLSLGLTPDVITINHLLEIAINSGLKIELVKEIAKELNIKLNSQSYEIILKGYFLRKEYESLILYYERYLTKKDIQLSYKTYQMIIITHCKLGQFDLVLELIQKPNKKILNWAIPSDPIHLVTYLRLFLENYHIKGSSYLFQLISNKGIHLDEGTCLNALNVAGRYGDTMLTTLSLKALSKIKVNLKEQHFIPIIESYLKGNKMEDYEKAIYLLKLMEQSHLKLEYKLLGNQMTEYFITNLHQSKLFFQFLKENNINFILCYNLLLSTYWEIMDVGRANEIFNLILTNDDLTPDIDTFNIMLKGYSKSNSIDKKDALLTQMTSYNIPKDQETYTQLIQLILAPLTLSNHNYEEAFTYLEEMKQKNYLPSYHLYATLIRRCAKARDPRAYIALDEMFQLGYNPPPSLRRYIETGGVSI